MKLFSSLADVLLPRYCKVCSRRLSTGEQHLCAPCRLSLPVLPYDSSIMNPVEQVLLAEPRLVRAASYFRYDKESGYSRILYHMKYYGHPAIGSDLAFQAALELKAKGFFDGIDLIVPVPLSKRKQRMRGYNQCDFIARGLSLATGIPVNAEAVARKVSNRRQAGQGRYQRWTNAAGIFCVSDCAAVGGRHILLVDDVVTTGATLLSLMDTLTRAADVSISVFTLASAV